jgi:hypothetical protein
MSEREAKEVWDVALGDRAEHELDCEVCEWFSGKKCRVGVHLAEVEQAAYAQWSALRRAGVPL